MSNLAITANTAMAFAEQPRWEINEGDLIVVLAFGEGINHAFVRLRLNEVEAGGLVSALISGFTALTKSTQL